MNQPLFLLLSGVICTLLFALRARKMPQVLPLCGLSLVLGAVLGTVLSKLVYYVSQLNFMIANGWLASLVATDPAQWCFFGGAAGVVLGVVLAARFTKVPVVKALDAFAPVGALLVTLAREAAFWQQDAMIAWGEYLENEALWFFPLAVHNEWGEYYLAVFMLEAMFALLVAVLALCCFKKHTFLRTVFYLCLGQIFLESLHSDSLSWLFVRVEQLLSMLVVVAVLVRYGLQLGKTPLWKMLAICVVCTGLFVGVEFALDKTPWPIPVIYGAMLLGLAALAVTEITAEKKLQKA